VRKIEPKEMKSMSREKLIKTIIAMAREINAEVGHTIYFRRGESKEDTE
jgi:hypothetical protein